MTEPVKPEFGLEVSSAAGPGTLALRAEIATSLSFDVPGLRLWLENLRVPLTLSFELGEDGPRFRLADGGPASGPPGGTAELALPGFNGGGYLTRTPEGWRGAVEARLGAIAVTGFAVITTDDFSLLVVLAAEFAVPIQLSFGFTLVGVGGVVGINRRPDIEALVRAASSGDLSRLMFPRNAVADAPRVLPALAESFPRSDGGCVVGPMVKLGWGTPTIFAATVAILASGEGMTVIGRVAMSLPNELLPLIRLEAIVVGQVDETGVFVAASLSNSTLLGFPIDGDLRVRLRTDEGGDFAVSAGGFHPAFAPPEGLTGMKRIGASFSPGSILTVRMDSYLALTSNTVQFGARVDLRATVAGCGLTGSFAFDALVALDPFGFMADFTARVSVVAAEFTVGSVKLSGHLSGPAPWSVRGRATVELPIVPDVDLEIPELTWGVRADEPLDPARDPVAVLTAQLREPANWTAASARVPSVVRLRPTVQRGTAGVHPLGALEFRQNAVPLNVALSRMDGRPIPAPTTVGVVVDGAKPAPLPAQFAPAQFSDLDDQARLSSAGYVSYDGGFVVTPSTVAGSPDLVSLDTRTPETTVLGKGLFCYRLPIVAAEQLRRFGWAKPVDPVVHADPESLMQPLRDPAEAVVTSRHDLTDRADEFVTKLATASDPVGLRRAIAHAGVAEALLGNGRTQPDLQVSRQWEVGSV